MTRHDRPERRAVRQFLLTGEQAQNGYTLSKRVYPQRTYVIARDLEGKLLWAFHVNPAGHLYRVDEGLLIALESHGGHDAGGRAQAEIIETSQGRARSAVVIEAASRIAKGTRQSIGHSEESAGGRQKKGK
jgi:hypothetical protein